MITNRKHQGFTLIELMIVVSIIGIMASVALPAYQDYVVRSEITEAISIGSTGKVGVSEFYRDSLTFPADNYAAAIPPPDKLIANRISSVTIEDGAVHVVMGHKASAVINGKTLTFRPATVDDSPLSPISWLCGYDEPIPGMTAVGDNKTDIARQYLPSSCRGPAPPIN